MNRAHGIGAPLAVALGVAVFAAAWRRYGVFDFADEGVLLSQAWRAAHGQVPHVDFETGYGPLFFWLQGTVFKAGGVVGIRLLLAVVHGIAAGFCFALARRLAGPTAAWVAVALQVAVFLPVSARLGTPLNVPYPAWYGGAAGVVIAWLVTVPAPRRMLVAGMLAGLIAAIKPNSGILLLVGAALAAVLGDGRRGILGAAIPAAVVLTAIVLVAPSGLSSTAVVLVPLVLAAALRVAASATDDRTAFSRLAALGVGFVAVVLPAYLPAFVTLGPAGFAHDVLLVGAGVAGVYELPFPSRPMVPTLALLALVAAGPPRRLWQFLGLLVLATLGALLAFWAASIDPGAIVRWLREDAEAALLVFAPLMLWGALAASFATPQVLAPVAVAATALLQLYPRPDFAHLLPIGPLLLPVLVVLPRTDWARTWGARLGALAAAVRIVPTALALGVLLLGRTETVSIGGEPFAIAPAGAPRLRALADTVQALTARTPPGTTVVAFPACTIVSFFADRRPVGLYDYFFPGRPDRPQVEALLATLAPAPPPVAITCTAEGTGLARAWDYYPEMVTFLDTRYRVATTVAPFTLREVTP